jgi:spore coat polysaccharide biosynthesis predicted glycosyltransferase SpsG/CMP-N-acetylneuraminic acid synthetase
MKELLVVIPAIKKTVAFPDDLVKKIAGISLLQRAISTASAIVGLDRIFVVTDSQEIALICNRQGVSHLLDASLDLPNNDPDIAKIWPHIKAFAGIWLDVLLLSPYAPTLSGNMLLQAYESYRNAGAQHLVTVRKITARLLGRHSSRGEDALTTEQELTLASSVFSIYSRSFLESNDCPNLMVMQFPVDRDLIEIRNYHDWWLCEKILNRRKIIFRVIGNTAVGMGHIYRCLAIAHEISDHEVYFVCDSDSSIAVDKIAGYDYWLGVYAPDQIVDKIIALQPDLVINDILDTSSQYVSRLQDAGARVINFEDFGTGALQADITINDLFDEPVYQGDNTLWGHRWFILRDEFYDATPVSFSETIKRILISFGGTDPSDYTCRVLELIAPYCQERSIGIDVITGAGYANTSKFCKLVARLGDGIRHTHATDVISQVMEDTQIAICSNGRTVYELAHMNIPALVLAQHEREKSHQFSNPAHGLVSVDCVDQQSLEEALMTPFKRLVEDVDWRRSLFDCMQDLVFTGNKLSIIGQIEALLRR